MDKAAEVASTMNTEVLKEPRGLIRIIHVIIAIFAFATTTSYSGNSEFTVTCPSNSTEIKTTAAPAVIKYHYSYPFRLHDARIQFTDCGNTKVDKNPYGDFSPPAQFYVFVGVMAFLYALGTLVLYIFFDEKYRKFDMIPIVDFIISCVFVVLWLIASSAWAQGVTNLKFYSNPEELWNTEAGRLYAECLQNKKGVCQSHGNGPFASLNVSLIFGFLNFLVWGAGLWFLWKETRWFKANQAPENVTPTQDPQRI